MINVKDKSFLIEFGNHLRKTRKQLGFSQEDLAIKADVSISQVSRIERAEINTTISTLKVLAEALDIKIQDFFEFLNE